MERRLAGILAADLVGYTRLTRDDEEGTIATLNTLRSGYLEPTVASFNGRIFKWMGDGFLVEFSSIVDAVHCAIKIQETMVDFNSERDPANLFQFRIGVNLGDVVVDGDDIHGDGVNLAARLESVATPGCVCVAESVHEQIRDRLDSEFQHIGEKQLKNIDRAVSVWQWPATEESASTGTDQPLALPDKPSIAVLPFANMSGDRNQEYFVDGVTEDIIAALSQYRWFFVISRNSSFSYKEHNPGVQQVGRELGVRYVLEGSIRKSGERIRVSVELVEAESGLQVWSERFDREYTEIFELQDEITQTIAGAVEPELAELERDRAMRKPTSNLGAWDIYQRGTALMLKQSRPEIISGMALVRQAIALDPGFGQAYSYLGYGYFILVIQGWSDEPDEMLAQGVEDAKKGIDLSRDYFAYHALGRLYTLLGDHAAALRALDTCVHLNPNFAGGYLGLGEAHIYHGDPNLAIDYLDTAIRLSPNDPMSWDMYHYKASAYVRLDDYDRAIENFEIARDFPTAQYFPSVVLAALYVMQGDESKGVEALNRARELEPGVCIATMKEIYNMTEERPGTRAQKIIDALRQIGLPETSSWLQPVQNNKG